MTKRKKKLETKKKEIKNNRLKVSEENLESVRTSIHEALENSQQQQSEKSVLLEGKIPIPSYQTFEDTLKSIFISCKKLIGATAGYLSLRTDNDERYKIIYSEVVEGISILPGKSSRSLGSMQGRISTLKTVKYENDFRKGQWEGRIPEGHITIENVLFAPLLIEEKTAGIICLVNKPDGFNENDVRLTVVFSEFAALAAVNSRTLELLEKSEEHFRSVMETATEVVITANSSSEIIYWNRAAEETFGYSTEEIIGKPVEMLIPGAFLDAHRKCIKKYDSKNKPVQLSKQLEIEGLRKDGTRFPIELSISSWETKEDFFFTAIGRDITERKNIENALRESEKRFRTLVEKSLEATFLLDLDLKFVFWNKAAEKLMGLVSSYDGDVNLADVLVDESFNRAKNIIARAARTGNVRAKPYLLTIQKADDSSADVEVISSIVEYDGKLHLLGTARDVTRHQQARKALENRIIALTQPEVDLGNVSIEDLVDISVLQKIQDEFARCHNVSSLMFSLDGEPVTKPSNFSKFCLLLRSTTEGLADCKRSDSKLGKLLQGEDTVTCGCCNFSQIRDGAVPIMIGDRYLGIWGIGQVLISPLPEDDVRRYARKIGIDEGELVNASKELKEMSEYNFSRVLRFTKTVADSISLLGLQNLQQARSIADRKRAEEALEAERRQLAVTLRSIGDGVIATDVSGNIVLLNNVAEKLTGWTEEEAKGNSLETVFSTLDPETRTKTENPVRKISETGKIQEPSKSLLLVSRNGNEKLISESVSPIRDSESAIAGVILVFRDITDQQKMEGEIQKIEKLESLGILAGGIAHDFNNILTGIVANISLAKMYISEDSKLFGILTGAEKASLEAKSLTQQLLTFSKGGVPVKETVSLAVLLKDAVDFTLLGSNVGCRFSIAEDLWTAEVDKGQISHVISNLVINANQSMPEGGYIDVSAENLTFKKSGKGDGKVENKLPLKPGDYIKVAIIDRGIGISKEYMKKIFDPYFTTKQEGSGLGLASAFAIIKKHEGYIDVESEQGKGSKFHIYLPASKRKVPVEKKPLEALLGSGFILLMDDKKIIRKTGTALLQELGYSVDTVEDGVEALARYIKTFEEGNPYTAVIMDLTIPGGMGGKEAAKQLLKIYPDAKIIASSGYSNDPVMSNFRDYGFAGVVSKPYTIWKIGKILKGVITKIRP